MSDIRIKMKEDIANELKKLDEFSDLQLDNDQLRAIISTQLDLVLLSRFKDKSRDAKNKKIIEGIEFI